MKIETDNMTSCLTTFATAWDYVHKSETSEGYSGIGPDILLGGYGDGIIKVFDLRAHQQQKAGYESEAHAKRVAAKAQQTAATAVLGRFYCCASSCVPPVVYTTRIGLLL